MNAMENNNIQELRYALNNTLGQVIASGTWNASVGASLSIVAPHAGKYILSVGKSNYNVVVK